LPQTAAVRSGSLEPPNLRDYDRNVFRSDETIAHWRGPEDAPVAVRPHRLPDDG
jgi:hypothetical protein